MDPITMAAIVQGAGTLASLYGGYKSGKAKKKSAKENLLQQMIARNMFMAGSEDAYGNKLSADSSGKWSYKLSNPSKQAVNNANKAMIKANTTADKTSAELMRDNLMGKSLANILTSRANQQAAMRSGARTNSNLGKISTSYGREGSQRLRDLYQQGVQAGKNATMYNTQMRDALNNNISTAQAPISNIQNNLQNMVNNLNGAVMNQGNNIARSSTNPYLHGQANADLWKGIGGSVSGFGQNIMQQGNFNKYLDLLKQMYGKSGGMTANG